MAIRGFELTFGSFWAVYVCGTEQSLARCVFRCSMPYWLQSSTPHHFLHPTHLAMIRRNSKVSIEGTVDGNPQDYKRDQKSRPSPTRSSKSFPSDREAARRSSST
jgi:hypothetical protein